jgi:hypothetical protein
MLRLNPEIAKRRIIRSMRAIKQMDAERRSSAAKEQSREVQADEQSHDDPSDREMRETFAMAAALSKEMGIEFEIPPAWR